MRQLTSLDAQFLRMANYPVSAIADGVGLNITVMSYRDRLDFGLVGDRDQIDDLWPLMRGLEKALDDLEELVGGKTPAPPVQATP